MFNTVRLDNLFKISTLREFLKKVQLDEITFATRVTDICSLHSKSKFLVRWSGSFRYDSICLIVVRILLGRNEMKIDQEISSNQSGFRPRMGTREGIFNLRTIMERYLEFGKDVYICFIDYDSVFQPFLHHGPLYAIKKFWGTPNKIL